MAVVDASAAPRVSCNDSNPCTKDVSVSGTCQHTPVAAGTSCSDGNPCNGVEACDGTGKCIVAKPAVVDDGNPCTTDTCTKSGGIKHTPVKAGTSCSDGNVCNGTETCNSTGVCVAGKALSIDDANPCTADSCDPVLGVRHTPVSPGTSCSDGNPCNGTETCDSSGVCAAGTPLAIDDGNPCTVDACSATSGVTHVPAAAGTSCADSNPCNGTEKCDGAGACAAGTPISVDDGNPCTLDSCDPVLGVRHAPAAAGTGCSDGNVCNGEETCNGSGSCVAGAVPSLDDGNPCTTDACSPSAGVTHTPVKAGTSCADSNPCNGTETCNASGVCSPGTPADIDDGNPCTLDTCSPTAGVAHVPLAGGTPCPDGNLCNGDEVCDGNGACLAGVPVPVGDENACTVDTCDPKLGVLHQPASPECASSAATWNLVLAGRPTPRDSAAFAYDAPGKRAILFGGETGGVALADTWAWDGSAWRTSAYLAGPSARAAAAMVFDADRRKMVLFGGMSRSNAGDVYYNDTWELDLATTTWAKKTPTTSPSARAMAAVGYDVARKKVVLFGGVGGTGDLGDTWEWDGGNWTSRTTTGSPPKRGGAAFVFHAARGVLTLAGGARFAAESWGAPLGDVWDFDGNTATWTERTTDPKPSARSGAAFSADSTGSVFLFGGTSPSTFNLSDVFRLDTFGSFHAEAPSFSPAARAGHAFAFDTTRARHVMFGGVSYSSTGLHTTGFDDLWEYEPAAASWTARSPELAPAYMMSGLAYDSARRLFVVRGADPRLLTWELDAAQPRWTAHESLLDVGGDSGAYRSVSAMSGASMFYDANRKVTVLLTAGRGTTPPGLWEWDGVTWKSRTCTGGPAGLYGAAVTFDPTRGKILTIGGKIFTGTSEAITPQFWELDVASCTWASGRTSFYPVPRWLGHLAWDSKRNVAVLFGGSNGFMDTYEWNGTTWSPKSPIHSPSARTDAAIGFDAQRGKVVLFGGYGSAYLDDVWEWDGTDWTLRTTIGGPSARAGASFGFDPERGRLVLQGGRFANNNQPADLWEWDGNAWERRRTNVVPSARSGAAGGWVPHKGMAVLFGGVRGDGAKTFLQDTWVWRDGEWLTASTGDPPLKYGYSDARAPSPRAGHAFVVGYRAAGALNGMGLLFGGEGDSGVLGDTWTFDDDSLRWSEYKPITYAAQAVPSARSEHALAVNVDVGYVMFGGEDATGALKSDTWNWSPNGGWAERTGTGDVPPPRRSHAMVADPVRKKILMFGGRGATGALRDTWEWDMAAGSSVLGWTKRSPTISPPAMFGHRLVYDAARAKILLTGGSGDDPNVTYGQTWEWDPLTGNWALREPVIPLEPRVGHVAFFDQARNETMVFGGFAYRYGGSASLTYGDMWSFARSNSSDAAAAKYPNGTPCSSDAVCSSGACVDGYCCNSACNGQCGACDVPGSIGTCVPVSGPPHGTRTNCMTSDLCGLRCDGKELSACHPLSTGATCLAQSCTSGMLTSASTCSSSGACGGSSTTSCAPYGCSGNACATRCYSDSDCFSAAYFCYSNYPYSQCQARAALTAFAYSPTTAKVGTALSMTAAATGYYVQYAFSYSVNGTTSYPCSTSSNTTCTFTPTVSGAYKLRVEARSSGSTQSFDDMRELNVTVSP